MRRAAYLPVSLFLIVFSSGALAAKYQTGAVSDGGTIKGKVVYRGSIPVKTVLPTKDKDTCGGPRKEPLVKVGGGGEVKDAIVHIKEIGKGKDWSKASATAAIDQKKCDFTPHVMTMRAGKLDILNSDPVLHNTHGYYGKNTAFNVALPVQGAKVTRVLPRPGVVRVDCDAHGWMEAWIYVVDNPYYAQTGDDGSFTLSDVPPGDYTLVVWQEHTGAMEVPVSVKAKGTVDVPIELKK